MRPCGELNQCACRPANIPPVVHTFESENQAYAVLLDRNDPEEDGVIFRIEEEEEEAFLVGIEDDAEWERVTAIYEQIAKEQNEGK
ncbi:DUF1292 domain-containing protein [Paenibacillus sp. P22]|uniref:DUF1292 domain-containing protein n=1 Tax=Paenibacillus sp. P22 TaxID=483908 RepID=UPI00065FC359|nr:DUF1292 domain-containing protein [Paenibacillus sp. P22]